MEYRFYINKQADENGHLCGFSKGYTPGDKIELAHRGFSEPPADGDLKSVCEGLFTLFNVQPPSSYRNSPMSIGDLVVLFPVPEKPRFFACKNLGFEEVPAVPLPAR